MTTEIHWIDGPWSGRLAISSRPRGGDWLEDEVRSWQQSGLNMIVSLLTDDEITDLNLKQQAELCEAYGLKFLAFPIADRGVPSSQRAAIDFLRKLEKALADGVSLLIHCRQGVGRSALMAASLLVITGLDPDSAFQRVSTARGVSVPETTEQRKWVKDFAQDLATEPAKL